MKQGIHPSYELVDVDVTSDHPFWTGTAKVVDAGGRVEAFRRRCGKWGVGA